MSGPVEAGQAECLNEETHMHDAAEPTVIELTRSDGQVVAVVNGQEQADGVLRRAIEEATGRSGQLFVLRMLEGSSVLRRAVAKAELTRDVAWWSRDLAGLTASADVVLAGDTGQAAECLQGAECVVVDSETLSSQHWLEAACRRVGHPWPAVSVVPTDHSR
jgi:hypothetical protein